MGEADPEERADGDTAVMIYPPHPDELLSSWIIRNSVAQGSDPMGWVYGFWGEWRAWTRDIDRYLPASKRAALSRFSRLPPETIREMTLDPIISSIEGEIPDVKRAWSWVIPTGKRNRSVVSGLQFCPECLKEKGGFFPRRWRLSWHTQCERHSIRLHDRCERCALPFSPHLIDYTTPHVHLCPRCGNDLRSAPSAPSSECALLLQKRIDRMLLDPDAIAKWYGRWGTEAATDFFPLLRDLLVLPVLLSKKEERYTRWQIFLLNENRFARPLSRAGLTFDMRSVREREMLLSAAFLILERGPECLVESLRHVRITRAILNERSFPRSPLTHRLLSGLPPAQGAERKRVGKEAPRSREPRTAEEVRQRMEAVRRFL